MTHKEALEALLAKVEAGDFDGNFNAFCDAWEGSFEVGRYADPWRAYNGSLDAAKALHEAVLPGWDWGCTNRDSDFEMPAAFVADPDDSHIGYESTGNSPARALLASALKALIAEQGE